MGLPKIDFDTMRSNCIQIHQEISEMFQVAHYIGVDLHLLVRSADELKSHEQTRSWDGMGRFAKQVYDDNKTWDILPEKLFVHHLKIDWVKQKAQDSLLDCYYHLGGNNLYLAGKQQDTAEEVTGLQEAFNRIDSRLKGIAEGDFLSDYERGVLKTLKDTKKMLEMLLEGIGRLNLEIL
jgi:hypothetical protein